MGVHGNGFVGLREVVDLLVQNAAWNKQHREDDRDQAGTRERVGPPAAAESCGQARAEPHSDEP